MNTKEQRQMTRRVCGVAGCGAHVFVLKANGQEIAVDIRPMEVVVPLGATDEFGVMTGYQPHAKSCLDISKR